MTRIEEIQEYLEMEDAPHLECDGATRVFSWILRRKGVEHTLMLGRLEFREPFDDDVEIVEPHYWIKLDTGEVVDFKARMWLEGREGVPHGVFNDEDYPKALYVGAETKMLITRTVYEILRRPMG